VITIPLTVYLNGGIKSRIREIESYKENLEISICESGWFKIFLSNREDVPKIFVEENNAALRKFQELDTYCKKLNIQGWTKDKAAMEYVACSGKIRAARNKALKEYKSYKYTKNDFLPILKSLGIDSAVLE